MRIIVVLSPWVSATEIETLTDQGQRLFEGSLRATIGIRYVRNLPITPAINFAARARIDAFDRTLQT